MAISASATYEILPLEDVTLAVEVAGNSTANKANARLWTRNDSNAQKWLFENVSGDVWYIKDAETGKCLEVYGGTANDKNGANVSMYTANASVAQKWEAEYVGTQAINGTNYETYQFVAFGGTTGTPRVMDVQGDGAYIRSNIQIHTQVVGHPSQTFALVPTEWNAIGGTGNEQAVLPTASGGTFGTVAGTALPEVTALSTGTIYPAWVCDETYYQVRYRTRKREAGESALGDWSDWMSIADGATTFYGWGTVGASNCTPTDYDGVKWSTKGVTVANNSTYDLTEVQFAARAWTAAWGEGSTVSAHGGAYTWSATTVKPVTVATPTAVMTPNGLKVGWDTDWTNGGNAVTIESSLFGAVNTVGDYDDEYVIPITALTHVPSSGETITMKLDFTTSDGLTVTYDGNVTVTYASGHATTMTLSATVIGTIATVACSEADAEAWLVLERGHGNRFVKLDGAGPWDVPAPLGVPWTIYAAVTTLSGWKSVAQEFATIDDKNYHITSQSLLRDLPIIGGVNTSQDFAPKYSRNAESASTYNRERPVNVLGGVTGASWTLKGAALPENYENCDWAVHAGHCYFRAPNGFWAQVAVTGGSIDYKYPEFATIEIACSEEVW